MSKKIITISREYGSGGDIIGKLLANHLGLPYYDNELLLLAHKRSDIRLSTIKEYDEKRGNRYLFYEVNHEGNSTVKKGESMEDTIYAIQKDAILSLAEKGNGAVIIGRCADAILKEAGYEPLTIFISAPVEFRTHRISIVEGIDEAAARKRVKHMDKSRQQFYESRSDQLWGHPATYDLCYNSAKYSNFDDIAELIAEYYTE